MPAQATSRSALTKRVPNYTHLAAHLAATCLNAFHLAYHLLKTYIQKVMTEMFEDVDSVEVVGDDIPVWGTNEAEHGSRLIKVLDRARLQNLKLNKSKCQFKKQEIAYLGHILAKDGLKPDPKKTQAINNMTPPTSKETLQCFLGMLTYLAKFIPNLSQTVHPSEHC